MLYALIVLIGAIPGARAEIGHLASGLVLHSLGYAAITLLLVTGLRGGWLRNAVIAFGTVAVMGALDEAIQTFLPYRRGRIDDWVVDITASAVTLLGLSIWQAYRAKA